MMKIPEILITDFEKIPIFMKYYNKIIGTWQFFLISLIGFIFTSLILILGFLENSYLLHNFQLWICFLIFCFLIILNSIEFYHKMEIFKLKVLSKHIHNDFCFESLVYLNYMCEQPDNSCIFNKLSSSFNQLLEFGVISSGRMGTRILLERYFLTPIAIKWLNLNKNKDLLNDFLNDDKNNVIKNYIIDKIKKDNENFKNLEQFYNDFSAFNTSGIKMNLKDCY